MAKSTTTKHRDEEWLIQENKPSLSHLWRLFAYVLSSAKAICIIYMLLTVSLSLLRPILAYTWGRYIDRVSLHLPGDRILPMIGLVLAYYLISFLCELIDRYTTPDRETIEGLDIVQMNRLQELFHSRLYRKIAALKPEYMEVPKIYDLIEQVFTFSGNHNSDLNRQVMIGGYQTIAKAVSVFSIAASLWFFHPMLTLLVLLAPIPTFYTAYVDNKLKFKLVKDNAKLRREFEYYEKLMLGPASKEIKALGLHEFFFNKWKKLNGEYTRKQKQTQVRTAILGMISTTIATSASVGGSILAIMLMVQGKISLGALGSVMILVRTLVLDTSILFTSVAAFISKKNEAGVFFDLNDLPEEAVQSSTLEPIQSMALKNVYYRYPLTDKYVLNGIDLSITRGEKVAFVGENGAGKTTLVKIISGLVSPSSGEFLINGLPVQNSTSSGRYSSMSAVFQDPARYNTFTIADNVYLGDTSSEANQKEITESLNAAGFTGADFHTLLGKDLGGTELSGGEWQKLAIARCWYRNKDFIILDEPTSNLDPLAEADLFRRYFQLSRNRTVIMVTHRISIASLCDRVVVFKEGKIVEDGSHEDLMLAKGEYARLHLEQAKWYKR